jgi:inorganic pyrophosphatase
MPNLLHLPLHDEDGNLQVVVESPRGSRAKIDYDPASQTFMFARPLVLGVAYPYDWGFIPSTRAEDGDPLDAMVYHDMATYPGVVIPAKPIGVVRLVEKDPGASKWQRNDRLIAVPADERRWDDATALEEQIQRELEQFFVVVTMMTGKKVRTQGFEGPKSARELVKKAARTYERGVK